MKKITHIALCLLLFSSYNLPAQSSWQLGGNNVSSSQRIGTNSSYALIFETKNSDRGRITSGGNWGIGLSDPLAKLHVNSTVSGQLPFQIGVLGTTKLLMHSNGGLAVGFSATPPSNGLLVNGNVGLGTTSPGSYKLKVVHGTFGVNFENSSSGDDWEFWVNSGGLSLYANDNFVGSFNPSTGAYTSVSDERLKTNIKTMPLVLDKVKQLKPATYQFKTTANAPGNAPDSYGFLAQDVMKVFPQLVTHTVSKERNLDQYTVDYSGFGVIAIKAIQEQQQAIQEQKQIIQEQKQLIQQLQQENNAFKDRFTKLEAAIGSVKDGHSGGLNGAGMLQVFPNPAMGTTNFNYSITKGASGKILVYNASGQLVRTLAAPDSGQVQMNASGLSAGKYTATLIIDGKVITSNHILVQ